MGSVCSTFGATCSAIGGWLSAGLKWAVSAAKWLWEKVSLLFKLVIACLRNLLDCFCGWFSYSRRRTYVESNGSRVEVGHEDLSFGVEVNRNRDTSVPSFPENLSPQDLEENLGEYLRNKVDAQERKRIAVCRKVLDTVDDAMKNDEHHERMPESEQKLGDFIRSPEVQQLLNEMNAINPGLA